MRPSEIKEVAFVSTVHICLFAFAASVHGQQPRLAERDIATEAPSVRVDAGTAGGGRAALGEQGISIAIVPIGTNQHGSFDADVGLIGNEVIMPTGGRRLFFEIRVGDWDPDDTGVTLKAYQFVVSAEGFSNAFEATLARLEIPCGCEGQGQPDPVCESTLGTGALCERSYLDTDQCACGGGFIDPTRPDFVLAGQSSVLCATDLSTDDTRAGCALIVGSQPAPEPFPPGGLYAGTVVVDIPPDARGTYTIALIPGETNLADQNSLPIPNLNLLPAKITIPVGRCCFTLDAMPQCVDGIRPDECDALRNNGFFTPGGTCVNGTEACTTDCNENGTPDLVEVDEGTAADCDLNGVLDECEPRQCLAVSAPTLALPNQASSRYLSVRPPSAGCNIALRVTFEQMPPGFEFLEGQVLWAGKPREICEHHAQSFLFPSGEPCRAVPGLPSRSFFGAKLECAPRYANLGARGTIHLFHEAIIPEGTYRIEAVHEGCDDPVEADFSPPLMVTTGVWGDVAGEFNPVTRRWSAPDGTVDLPTDILATVDKFANRFGAPITVFSDVAPGQPDGTVDMTVDIVYIIDAFRGFDYPFTASDPCP